VREQRRGWIVVRIGSSEQDYPPQSVALVCRSHHGWSIELDRTGLAAEFSTDDLEQIVRAVRGQRVTLERQLEMLIPACGHRVDFASQQLAARAALWRARAGMRV
jgi:hypothetical protein